jgi:hypothetical protein
MSQADSAKKGRKRSKPKPSVMGDVLGLIDQAIDNVDEAAAAERVAALREADPEAMADELVELLVKQKCMQTGTVGAVTSGAALIPGLGTLVSLTFGVAADIGLTFKMQAELVLEIASVYERKLTPDEKRQVVLLVTGLSAGASQALRKAGERIAEKAGERLAQKSVTKAIPVLGVAASAGTNILFTYAIGQRAQAYFSLGPEAVGDWAESIRALTGVDERIVAGWLTETTERSWQLVSGSAQSAAGAVIVAGKSAGEVVVVGAGKASEALAGVGQGIASGAGAAAGAVVGAGKKAGEAVAGAGKSTAAGVANVGKKAGETVAGGASVAAGAVAGAGKKAGETMVSAGRTAVEGASAAAGAAVDAGKKAGEAVAEGTSAAAGTVVGAGKKAGAGIATGVGKAGEAAAGAGRHVGEGALKALKTLKRGKGKEEAEDAEALE